MYGVRRGLWDSDESFEPFRWQNNRRLPEKNSYKMGLNKHMQILTL